MPYLTPPALPDGRTCRQLTIPDDPAWISIVSGALLTLSRSYNFEQINSTDLTPDETARAFLDMFFEYRDLGEVCMLGAIIPSIIDLDPPKFLYCNGDTYNRVDYPRLYAALPSDFIVDADTLQTPDLTGSVIAGLNPFSITGFDSLFAHIGTDLLVLAEENMPEHTHSLAPHTHAEGTTTPTTITIGPGAPAPAAIGAAGTTGSGGSSVGYTGEGNPFVNVQPTFIAKYYLVAR